MCPVCYLTQCPSTHRHTSTQAVISILQQMHNSWLLHTACGSLSLMVKWSSSYWLIDASVRATNMCYNQIEVTQISISIYKESMTTILCLLCYIYIYISPDAIVIFQARQVRVTFSLTRICWIWVLFSLSDYCYQETLYPASWHIRSHWALTI